MFTNSVYTSHQCSIPISGKMVYIEIGYNKMPIKINMQLHLHNYIFYTITISGHIAYNQDLVADISYVA